MKTLAAKVVGKKKNVQGYPGRRRHRPDQLEDRHAPIAEALRPAERDAERVANDCAGREAERPQAQRVADADQNVATPR